MKDFNKRFLLLLINAALGVEKGDDAVLSDDPVWQDLHSG